jgi:hypothetical protein
VETSFFFAFLGAKQHLYTRLCWLVGPLVGPSVGPHITSKTNYVAIASRRGEGRGNQLMAKTGYVEIASRLVTVAHSCL